MDGSARCFQGVHGAVEGAELGGLSEPRRSLVYWDLPSGWGSQSDVEGLPLAAGGQDAQEAPPQTQRRKPKRVEPGRLLEGSQRCPPGGPPTPRERLGGPGGSSQGLCSPQPHSPFLRPCPSGSRSYQPVGAPHVPREGGLQRTHRLAFCPSLPTLGIEVFTRRMWYPSQWMGLLGWYIDDTACLSRVWRHLESLVEMWLNKQQGA